MTESTIWPPIPADRVRHGWRCTRNGPIEETIRYASPGQPVIVSCCQECDGTDLAEWIRAEAERRPT
jgi:hypothetical protein